MEIVIAVTRKGAEERRLYEAARQQDLAVRLCTAGECVQTGRAWPPGAVVLNRVLSFNQALALAHLVEAHGGRSVNSAAVIHACGDKVAATARLWAARVAMPQTRIAFSREEALAAIEEMGYPVVVKPVVGSWGRLLAKVNDRDAAEGVLSYQQAHPSPIHSVHYLQQFVRPPCRDLRVLVTGDRVVCAVERQADHWIRNLTRHERPHPVEPTDELGKCALAAAAAVGGGVLGVDILEDDDGQLLVLEVNHRPEFRWTQQAAEPDIAAAVIEWLRESVR